MPLPLLIPVIAKGAMIAGKYYLIRRAIRKER